MWTYFACRELNNLEHLLHWISLLFELVTECSFRMILFFLGLFIHSLMTCFISLIFSMNFVLQYLHLKTRSISKTNNALPLPLNFLSTFSFYSTTCLLFEFCKKRKFKFTIMSFGQTCTIVSSEFFADICMLLYDVVLEQSISFVNLIKRPRSEVQTNHLTV